MPIDASAMFILILTVGCVGIIAWAQVHSRRQHAQTEATESATSAATSEDVEEVPEENRRTHRRA